MMFVLFLGTFVPYLGTCADDSCGNYGISSAQLSINNTIRGPKMEACLTGNIDSVIVWVVQSNSEVSDVPIKVAIYDKDGNLVDSCNVFTVNYVPDDTRYKTNTYNSPSVTLGDSLIVVAWSDGTGTTSLAYYSDDPETEDYAYSSETYGAWPDPWSFNSLDDIRSFMALIYISSAESESISKPVKKVHLRKIKF